jgi:hypothetical protein
VLIRTDCINPPIIKGVIWNNLLYKIMNQHSPGILGLIPLSVEVPHPNSQSNNQDTQDQSTSIFFSCLWYKYGPIITTRCTAISRIPLFLCIILFTLLSAHTSWQFKHLVVYLAHLRQFKLLVALSDKLAYNTQPFAFLWFRFFFSIAIRIPNKVPVCYHSTEISSPDHTHKLRNHN